LQHAGSWWRHSPPFCGRAGCARGDGFRM